MATYFRTDGWVKSALGPAVPGAQIYICTQPANTNIAPPTPLATIFSDVNGLVPITQPIIADGFGHYDFYTSPGTYTLVIAYGGVVQQVYPDQNVAEGSPVSGSIVSSDGSVAVTQDGNGNTNLAVQTITSPYMLGPGIFNLAQIPALILAAIAPVARVVSVCKFLLTATISGLTHLDGSFGCNLGPGSHFAIGIYSAAGDRLWTSGALFVPNVTNQSSSFTVPALSLTAGTTYYMAWTADDTGNTSTWCTQATNPLTFNSSTLDGNVINQGTVMVGTAANAATVGPVLPSTLGALSIPVDSSFRIPLVFFR
jgi:hypothetical protein